MFRSWNSSSGRSSWNPLKKYWNVKSESNVLRVLLGLISKALIHEKLQTEYYSMFFCVVSSQTLNYQESLQTCPLLDYISYLERYLTVVLKVASGLHKSLITINLIWKLWLYWISLDVLLSSFITSLKFLSQKD